MGSRMVSRIPPTSTGAPTPASCPVASLLRPHQEVWEWEQEHPSVEGLYRPPAAQSQTSPLSSATKYSSERKNS